MERPFTADQEQQFCRDNLPWAERYLRTTLGPHAAEYAGIGLLEALRSYDPSRGTPFSAWLRKKLYWVARDEIKREHGAVGTARYEGQRNAMPVQDDDAADAPEAGRALSAQEQYLEAHRWAERWDYETCMTIRGVLLADLDDRTIASLLDVSRSRTREHIRLVRQFGCAA